MRRKVTKETLDRFMRELGAASRSPGRVYFTGGATALLLGFREQTVDVDVKLDPEPEGAFEAISTLKNKLDLNVELASPDDFIPGTKNSRERSRPIATHGSVEFLHFDFTLQVLAKLERGHRQDLEDAASFLRTGHVTAAELRARFREIEPQLMRYPAVDPQRFKQRVEEFLAKYAA
jgi:hypothetical protein